MVSLLDSALSRHDLHLLTSPRVMVAFARLGMSPEELEYDLQAQAQDKNCDLYLGETGDKLNAVKQMVEYIDKYGVTEEEGMLYSLESLVSANPLANEVIELCAFYKRQSIQKVDHNHDEFNVEEHPFINTWSDKGRTKPSNPLKKVHASPEHPRIQRTSRVLSPSQSLSFEDRIAQKRASISAEKARMIAKVEAALQTHARDMEAQTTHQQEKAVKRYAALERLLKEKEEARQTHLLKQHLSAQRRENAVKTLAEIDLNRATLLQYNLHVKELKRRRFLELRDCEREQQRQKGLLNSFYADVVRHRREERLAKKQKLAEMAIAAKQKVFSLLDHQAIINACHRGLQMRDSLTNETTKLSSHTITASGHLPEQKSEWSQKLVHAHNDTSPKNRLRLSKSLCRNSEECEDVFYITTAEPLRPVL